MDIVLERLLSLIPQKEDGKFVHGAKKQFCESIGAPTNIVSEWIAGKTKSYRNYVFVAASVYGVDPNWILGKTDEKEKPTTDIGDGFTDEQRLIFNKLMALQPEEREKKLQAIRLILDL